MSFPDEQQLASLGSNGAGPYRDLRPRRLVPYSRRKQFLPRSILTLPKAFVHSSGTFDYRVWLVCVYSTKPQLNVRIYLLS